MRDIRPVRSETVARRIFWTVVILVFLAMTWWSPAWPVHVILAVAALAVIATVVIRQRRRPSPR